MITKLQSRIIVQKPSELTTKWAQNILHSNPNSKIKNYKINTVEVISVDIGTTTRVRLAVDHDGPDALPKRCCQVAVAFAAGQAHYGLAAPVADRNPVL